MICFKLTIFLIRLDDLLKPNYFLKILDRRSQIFDFVHLVKVKFTDGKEDLLKLNYFHENLLKLTISEQMIYFLKP